MNNKLMSRYASNGATLSHLEDNQDTWKIIPAFSEAFTTYKQKHDEVSGIAKDKAQKIAGIYTSKNNKKDRLVTKALSLSGSLRAWASKSGNDALLAAMTFNATELKNMRDHKLAHTCGGILDALNEQSSDMGNYNITAPMIAEFAEAILQFTKATSAARNATSERKSIGQTVGELLDDMSRFAEDQLDPLMLRFAESHPLFYKEYQNNRIIIDPKTSTTRFSGRITDKETGLPIKNVMVSVKDTAYITNAKADGTYKLPVPKNGTYTLVFEVAGYEPVTITEAELKLGKNTEVDVVMQRVKS